MVQHQNTDDLLWRHLKTVPAFRALLRAVEARFYRHVEIPGPVLDLGCGDGHFAQMAFSGPLMAGADPWWGPLQKARRAGIYRLNVQALGDALPFPGEQFASVISNSVLEHIPDVQPVLREANRVLRPGGRLVITMPSNQFTENLGGARLLDRVGLGDSYRSLFNFISRHAHTDSAEQWAQRLAQAGFQVSRWQYYFSDGALHALELGHLQGLPSAVLHALTGHWVVAPWRSNLRPTERWLRPYYEEEPTGSGAYLFLVARKVAGGPVLAALPAQRPFTMAELAAEEPAPAPAVSADEQEVAEELPIAAAALASQEDVAASASPQRAAPVDRQTRVRGHSLLLLAFSLLLALLGQSVLSAQPPDPSAGVQLYAGALLFLAATVIYRRYGPVAWPRPGQIPSQRLLYPLALLLALVAHRQVGASLFDGNPALAFLLWFGAIALAVYSLKSFRRSPTSENRGEPAVAGLDIPATGATEPTPVASLSALQRTLPLLIPLALFLLALLPRLIALQNHPFIITGIEASLGLDAAAVARGQIRNPFATAWLTNPTLPAYLLALPLQLLGHTALGLRLLSAVVGALTIVATYLVGNRLWNRTVGLVAAILLAGSHFHLQYSRLGMNNIWDPFWPLLALGLLYVARQRGQRAWWLLAGLAIGLNAYFYAPSHLMPLILLGVALYFLIFERCTLWEQGSHILAALALALVVGLPQLLYYNAVPGVFMERANILGIFQNNWLVQETTSTGQSQLTLLGQQLAQAFLAFNYSLDTSSSYNPGIPLLRFWPAIFLVLGAGLALLRLRQLRYSLLLIWLGVTLLFAGALLLDPPDSHRLLIAAPAVYLLVAIGLVWLVRQLWQAVPNLPQNYLLHLALLLALLIVAGDLAFYFGQYRNEPQRFADRNTEIAAEIGHYLDDLEGPWVAYFHGPPAMYVDFPTIPFLATAFQSGQNMFNVDAPEGPLPSPPSAEASLVFLYLPERSGELEATAARYPGGDVRTFSGVYGDPLFYAYEVRR